MTSTARISSTRSGFSLIEIVMVLLIAAMVLGGALTYLAYSSEEKAMKDASSQLEVLAKRARAIAVLQQTPYALEFRPGVIRLLPLAEAGQDETQTASGHTIGGERVVVAGSNGPVHDEINLDPELSTFFRHWNTETWLPMSDRIVHIWRFDPDGLCEPVSVRITAGENFIESTYHPLTASIVDTVIELHK